MPSWHGKAGRVRQFTRVYKMADEKGSKPAKLIKSAKTSNVGADNRFSWSSEIIQALLDALLDSKSYMEYNNSDVNADKNKQYKAVRAKLASQYMHDTSMSGPEKIEPISEGDNRDKYLKKCEDDKAMIRKGTSFTYSKTLKA